MLCADVSEELPVSYNNWFEWRQLFLWNVGTSSNVHGVRTRKGTIVLRFKAFPRQLRQLDRCQPKDYQHCPFKYVANF
jgi:hypothetical protein